MEYSAFQIIREIRKLPFERLAQQLFERLTGKMKTSEPDLRNKSIGLHLTNVSQILRLLARMTAYIEVQSGSPSLYITYVESRGKACYEIEHVLAGIIVRYRICFQICRSFSQSEIALVLWYCCPSRFMPASGTCLMSRNGDITSPRICWPGHSIPSVMSTTRASAGSYQSRDYHSGPMISSRGRQSKNAANCTGRYL